MRKHTLDFLPPSAITRFWKYVRPSQDDECWSWVGTSDPNGYGRIGVTFDKGDYRGEYAHRISFLIHHGPIPAGMVVMHTCDNPECANPGHLKLGTQKDNMHDRDAKGRDRFSRGYLPNRSIPSETVTNLATQYESGMTLQEIADGCSFSVSAIRDALVRHGVKLRPGGLRKGQSHKSGYKITRQSPYNYTPISQSGYLGVKVSKAGRWEASIRFQGQKLHLGTFDTPEEAARAYDRKSIELRGELACLNFPDRAGEEAGS